MQTTTRPEQDASHQTRGTSRRTVVRTAAWATPVVLTAVAAPAFAATSGGDCTQVGSAQLSADHSGIVRTLVFPGGVSATISYAKTRGSNTLNPFDGETGHIFTTDYGRPWKYIRLHHAKGMHQDDTLTMTIDFDQPVHSFSLTITDIDMTANQWIDHVSLAPAGFGVDARGRDVIGAGTAASPFSSSRAQNIDSADGDVTVTWSGATAMQSFTITYVAADDQNRSEIGQMIGIGKFTYNNCY